MSGSALGRHWSAGWAMTRFGMLINVITQWAGTKSSITTRGGICQTINTYLACISSDLQYLHFFFTAPVMSGLIVHVVPTEPPTQQVNPSYLQAETNNTDLQILLHQIFYLGSPPGLHVHGGRHNPLRNSSCNTAECLYTSAPLSTLSHSLASHAPYPYINSPDLVFGRYKIF